MRRCTIEIGAREATELMAELSGLEAELLRLAPHDEPEEGCPGTVQRLKDHVLYAKALLRRGEERPEPDRRIAAFEEFLRLLRADDPFVGRVLSALYTKGACEYFARAVMGAFGGDSVVGIRSVVSTFKSSPYRPDEVREVWEDFGPEHFLVELSGRFFDAEREHPAPAMLDEVTDEELGRLLRENDGDVVVGKRFEGGETLADPFPELRGYRSLVLLPDEDGKGP